MNNYYLLVKESSYLYQLFKIKISFFIEKFNLV